MTVDACANAFNGYRAVKAVSKALVFESLLRGLDNAQ